MLITSDCGFLLSVDNLMYCIVCTDVLLYELSIIRIEDAETIELLYIDCFPLTKGQCSKRQTILSVLAVHRPFYISILFYIDCVWLLTSWEYLPQKQIGCYFHADVTNCVVTSDMLKLSKFKHHRDNPHSYISQHVTTKLLLISLLLFWQQNP